MAPRIEYQTREEWLQAAAREFASELFEAQGYAVPRIRVGVGFPSAGKRSNVIGECWTRAASGDDTHEIIIRTVRLTRKWADVAVPKCPNPECERFGEPLSLEGR